MCRKLRNPLRILSTEFILLSSIRNFLIYKLDEENSHCVTVVVIYFAVSKFLPWNFTVTELSETAQLLGNAVEGSKSRQFLKLIESVAYV